MLKLAIKKSAYLIAPQWAARIDQRLWLSKQAALLRRRCNDLKNLEDIVDEVFRSATFTASQKKTEILLLLNLLKDLRPKYVCEIGTAGGGTLFLLCQVAEPGARFLSIDINYTPSQLRAYRYFARPGQKVTCLKADSHSSATRNKLGKWLGRGKLDFLFIDGDHSFSGVSSDYSMYGPYVRPGGIVAFHDVVPDFRTRYGIPTSSYVGEVPVFWHSLKQNGHNTLELIEDPEQDGYGIGILQPN